MTIYTNYFALFKSYIEHFAHVLRELVIASGVVVNAVKLTHVDTSLVKALENGGPIAA